MNKRTHGRQRPPKPRESRPAVWPVSQDNVEEEASPLAPVDGPAEIGTGIPDPEARRTEESHGDLGHFACERVPCSSHLIMSGASRPPEKQPGRSREDSIPARPAGIPTRPPMPSGIPARPPKTPDAPALPRPREIPARPASIPTRPPLPSGIPARPKPAPIPTRPPINQLGRDIPALCPVCRRIVKSPIPPWPHRDPACHPLPIHEPGHPRTWENPSVPSAGTSNPPVPISESHPGTAGSATADGQQAGRSMPHSPPLEE